MKTLAWCVLAVAGTALLALGVVALVIQWGGVNMAARSGSRGVDAIIGPWM